MNKVMKPSKKYVVPFMVVGIVASLSSCSSHPISHHLESTMPTANTTTNSQLAAQAATDSISSTEEMSNQNKASLSSVAVTKKTLHVSLFTSDTQCQELIPQQVLVPKQEPVISAVGNIIKQFDSADFSLSGYSVTVKNRVATVDLQISPDSERQFTSLSSCEQFALFGSVRKTLLSHVEWNIKKVRFTHRGEEIVV
ncbi:sporulation/spore germination protein [Scytonema sp. PRP1]|uniref:sporulation/spore germination protein n=1 Tax=Scytonema sp. PRP1 TaxID=3120513 RepID=UPI002FCFAFC2